MTGKKFEELVEVLRKLRKECPWDAEQTNESIKAATLEEAHEVVEAIDDKDFNELKGELGDLLLHIVFHSVIAEDEKHFHLNEVIDGITEKLVRRHPHVFGDEIVNHNHEIERNWEKIKLEEGRDSVLQGVPKNLPGLYKAYRLQQKASKIGFDWSKKEEVWDKVLEEINEMQEMEKAGNKEKLESEIGDVIFSIVNYARFIGINPEDALRKTNDKFTNQFQYIEDELKKNGKKITDSNLKEMDRYWEESKKILD
jgi:XTP/dITP diphosphohydrolase